MPALNRRGDSSTAAELLVDLCFGVEEILPLVSAERPVYPAPSLTPARLVRVDAAVIQPLPATRPTRGGPCQHYPAKSRPQSQLLTPATGTPARSALGTTARRRVGALGSAAPRTRSSAKSAASFGARRRSSASASGRVGSASSAIGTSIAPAAVSRRAPISGRRPDSTGVR